MNALDPVTVAESTIKTAEKMGAYQAEVLAYSLEDAVTRFSRKSVNQSAVYSDTGIYVRIMAAPGKLATSFTRRVDEKSVVDTIRDTFSLAKLSTENEHLRSFAPPRKPPRIPQVYVKRTAQTTDETRGEDAKIALEAYGKHDGKISHVTGTITTRIANTAICNSLGLDVSHRYTGASVVEVILAESNGSTGIGFSSYSSNDYRQLNFEKVTEEAAAEAITGINPKELKLGSYDVILEPDAAGDCLGTFVQQGFSVQRLHSYVKLGAKCTDEQLTVVDDPQNTDTLMATPFDAEGTTTKRLTLIERGFAKAQCFDRISASRAGKKTTGHALFQHDLTYVSKFFPGWVHLPANQIVKPGNAGFDELIAESKKAVIVKRLMYAGLPSGVSESDVIQAHTMGTWLVENGEIKCALPSLRISESLAKMMRRIDRIGDRKTVKRIGCINMPAIKVKDVRFTETASLSVPEGLP